MDNVNTWTTQDNMSDRTTNVYQDGELVANFSDLPHARDFMRSRGAQFFINCNHTTIWGGLEDLSMNGGI